MNKITLGKEFYDYYRTRNLTYCRHCGRELHINQKVLSKVSRVYRVLYCLPCARELNLL